MTTKTQTYVVDGMSCDHCVAAVRAEVATVPGVESVVVDLAEGTVVVVSQVEVDRALVAAAVDEAGYVLVGADGP